MRYIKNQLYAWTLGCFIYFYCTKYARGIRGSFLSHDSWHGNNTKLQCTGCYRYMQCSGAVYLFQVSYLKSVFHFLTPVNLIQSHSKDMDMKWKLSQFFQTVRAVPTERFHILPFSGWKSGLSGLPAFHLPGLWPHHNDS